MQSRPRPLSPILPAFRPTHTDTATRHFLPSIPLLKLPQTELPQVQIQLPQPTDGFSLHLPFSQMPLPLPQPQPQPQMLPQPQPQPQPQPTEAPTAPLHLTALDSPTMAVPPKAPTKTKAFKVGKTRKTKSYTPINAYIAYTIVHRTKVRQENTYATNQQILQILGEMWRGVAPSEKQKYTRLAEQLNQERGFTDYT